MSEKDASNYRKADNLKKSCQLCKFWDPNDPKVTQDGSGRCKKFDFNCKKNWVCDAWAGKTQSEDIKRISNYLED